MTGPRLIVAPAGALEDLEAGLMRMSDFLVLCQLGTIVNRKGETPYATKQSWLAQKCGYGRQKVNDAIAVLEWLGWLEVMREEGDDKPCRYKVLLDYQQPREAGTAPDETLKAFKASRAAAKRRSWGSTAHLPDALTEEGVSPPDDTRVSSQDDRGGVVPGRLPGVVPGRQGVSSSSTTGGVVAATTAVTTHLNDKPPSPLSGGDPGRPACADPDGRCASGPGRSGEDGGEGHGDGANGVRQSAEADGGGDVREGSARGDGGAGDGAPEPSLTPERFRDFIKARAGPEAWRDHFVRCRVADGRLIAPTRSTAWGLWERFGGLLTELGVETIRAEHEQCEVRR